MGKSIWSKSAEFSAREPLAGNLTVDAAVIGGGMAGVLAACFLKSEGLRVVVLEASCVGSGQTRNTTAKITAQHGLIYDRLIGQLGEEQARLYAAANQWAVGEYRRMVIAQGIGCDFSEAPAFLYSTTDVEPLKRELAAARRLGIDASLYSKTELPFPVAGALRFDGQARFHPLKFLYAVAEPLAIYEQTVVRSVEGTQIHTDRGTVTAEQIIFACHFPFVNLPGFYFMRMHQERSYVLALDNAAHPEGMYLGVDVGGLSFRRCGDLLLLGGGSHHTGENSAGGRYRMLREVAERHWPQSREVAAWSAQDCMTLDGVPYIGRFASSTPNWFVATGFQKWGMSSSMVAARMISDLIVRGESPWETVFSPQRFKPSASAKALIRQTVQATKGLAREVFSLPQTQLDALPAGHGGVVEYDGNKVGVYKDESGEAFLVSVRCPHMGCQLAWNPDEKSWDCPCHGSRFDYRGKLIDNPAQEDLNHA